MDLIGIAMVFGLLSGIFAAEDEPVLKDEKAKRSYALGMETAHRLKGTPDLDPELFSRGVKDALTGAKTLLTEEEQKAVLAAIRAELKGREEQAQKQLAEKNTTDGEVFLAENKTKASVVTLESGLQYRVLTAGKGAKPSVDDTVVCHYRGTLIDGKEFDSSLTRNQPATIALKKVIKGWSEALLLMTAGSKWQLFIPPTLAYGERGAGGRIGPNATLIFEVELLSIKAKPQVATRPAPSRKPAKDEQAKP